ncbi:MAG: PaaI family thioesterase [Pseudomonadota bacterium]|nr:PaaI family thioesterase [Pseudomonadota bacterium]
MSSKAEIVELLAREFPHNQYVVEEAGDRSATVSHPIGAAQLRPGNTVSGPVLMAVADVALYVAILATIGMVPLAVTTSLTINFLKKPSSAHPIKGVCRLMKVGRALVVGEVALYSGSNSDMVAHAVGTFSVPPKR